MGVHAKLFGRRQDSAFQDEEERCLNAQGGITFVFGEIRERG